MLKILPFRITNEKTFALLKKIVKSYSVVSGRECLREKGIPIGNLTSQIFANIYLNELDRFAKHAIKPMAYLRYGDDFIIIFKNFQQLLNFRKKIINFIRKELLLEINAKNDIIVKARWGLKFLGVEIFPTGRRLNKRNWRRVKARINLINASSYSGLVKQHSKHKKIKELNWIILEKLNEI